MKKPENKVRLELTEGYQQRFTQACLKRLKEREEREKLENYKKEAGQV